MRYAAIFALCAYSICAQDVRCGAAASLSIGDTAPFAVTLASPATDGVIVSLTSSNPSKLIISPANIFISQGATAPNRAPSITALDNGSVTVACSVFGAQPVTATITIGQSTPIPPGPSPALVAPALVAAATSPTSVSLAWTASAGATAYTVERNGAPYATTGVTTFADTVSASSTWTYGVRATATNAASLLSNLQTVTTPATTGTGACQCLSACGSITSPGTYGITTALIAKPQSSCLKIRDVAGVKIYCGGKSIIIDRLQDGGGDSAIFASNAPGLEIRNCSINLINVTPTTGLPVISIDSSPGAVLDQSTVRNGWVSITNSPDVQVTSSTFQEATLGVSGDRAVIDDNTFSLSNRQTYGTAIGVGDSIGPKVRRNVIHGGWDGLPYPSGTAPTGADDGVVFSNVSNVLSEDNVIDHMYDACQESTGYVRDSIFRGNRCTTANYADFGAYYDTVLTGNTWADNVVTDAPMSFYFFRAGIAESSHLAEFANNTFSGNRRINPRPGLAAFINFQGLPVGTTANASNNVFSNNDFGASGMLLMTPVSAMVNGGGNRCDPTTSTPSTICH